MSVVVSVFVSRIHGLPALRTRRPTFIAACATLLRVRAATLLRARAATPARVSGGDAARAGYGARVREAFRRPRRARPRGRRPRRPPPGSVRCCVLYGVVLRFGELAPEQQQEGIRIASVPRNDFALSGERKHH